MRFRLRTAAEAALRESEALQREHRVRLAEAAEAGGRALDISRHAQHLELRGLQQEADNATRHAVRYSGCSRARAGLTHYPVRL